MLQNLYHWMMGFAAHRRAVWVLGLISFAESSFFPLPPDPLYLAMVLEQREKAWRFAALCTVTSVVGGILGYYIGFALYETFGKMIIDSYGLHDSFNHLQAQFHLYGFWLIALKGLTPIPYKVVTIASGVASYDFGLFILASVIARGFRFFLLAGLLRRYGPQMKEYIEENLKMVTTVGLLALLGGFLLLKYIF